jgi:hypothetical protein
MRNTTFRAQILRPDYTMLSCPPEKEYAIATQWLASRWKLCASQQASFYNVTENKLNKLALFSPSQCCAYRSCHVQAHSYFHIVTAGRGI